MAGKLIPERLKAAREKMGISMTEAARRLELSKIGYCRYEYGDRVPSPQTVEVIAQCFNTSVEYLIGEREDSNPDKIVVDKNKMPELYSLVEAFMTNDMKEAARLYEYCMKLENAVRKDETEDKGKG